MLLDGGRRIDAPELLAVAGDMQGLDLGQGEGLRRAPVREARGGRDLGQPGIGIADVRPKERPKPLLAPARIGKERRGEPARNPGRHRRPRRPAFRYRCVHSRRPAIGYS